MKRVHTGMLALMGWSICAGVSGAAQHPKKSAPTAPQAKSTPVADDPLRPLLQVQEFAQVAISPDGKRVAWGEIQKDKEGAPAGKNLVYVSEYENGGKPLRITAGASGAHFEEHDLAWSPDNKHLAF